MECVITTSPAVKAYELSNKIIVKYYDDGDKQSMSCPYCHWTDDVIEVEANELSEVFCPCCNSCLGLIAKLG